MVLFCYAQVLLACCWPFKSSSQPSFTKSCWSSFVSLHVACQIRAALCPFCRCRDGRRVKSVVSVFLHPCMLKKSSLFTWCADKNTLQSSCFKDVIRFLVIQVEPLEYHRRDGTPWRRSGIRRVELFFKLGPTRKERSPSQCRFTLLLVGRLDRSIIPMDVVVFAVWIRWAKTQLWDKETRDPN